MPSAAQKASSTQQQPKVANASSSSAIPIIIAIATVMAGCCANFFSLEMLISKDRTCGSMVTVAQFGLIALEGFLLHIDFQPSNMQILKKRTIPFYYYIFMVTVFFLQSYINNWVFEYGISLPLHGIFRSGSLVMSMLIGFLFFKERFSFASVVTLGFVTYGIVLATLVSSPSDDSLLKGADSNFASWLFGVVMLVISQLLSALLGYIQKYAYENFGKNWRENMFYSHALSIPFFVLMISDVKKTYFKFNESPVLTGPLAAFGIPEMWFYLALNVVTQYVCIRGVYSLSALTKPLTLTLVITVRKFVSLLFSIMYFGNTFTFNHWLATFLVFGGSVVFTFLQLRQPKQPEQESKKQK